MMNVIGRRGDVSAIILSTVIAVAYFGLLIYRLRIIPLTINY